MNATEPINLEAVLDRMDQASRECERVSIGHIFEIFGNRSFGSLLLVLGLIPASPLSGIPGVSSLIAAMVILISGQLLFRRSCCWLPSWMLRRSVSHDRLEQALRFMRPVAQSVDKVLHIRLPAFTGITATYVIAALCIVISVAMPLLEVIPFANTTAGAALALFGLALIAKDSLLVLISAFFCSATLILILRSVLC